MLTQGRFLISYQVFDNIQVNNIGQTHVREILKDTQAFTINYRTEQIRDYLKSYIIARYYGWEPKEEDLEEIISHTSFFDINIDDAIYEVLTMPSRDGNPITRKQKSFINLRYQTYSNN